MRPAQSWRHLYVLLTLTGTSVRCSSDVTPPHQEPLGPVVNGVRTAGSVSLLVVPARFAGSAPSPFTSSDLQRRYFDGPGESGTLSAYFAEISGNRFRLGGTVTDWVQTSVQATESGDGVEGISREDDYVIEALRAADATVDFNRFDNDGPDGVPGSADDDGVVDGGVMIVTPEPGRQCGPAGAVWPHVAMLSARNAPDGVFRVADRSRTGSRIAVRSYVIVPAQSCTPGTVTGIAVAAHELMHLFFQVTEMYSLGSLTESQPGGARLWRTGCWDVMSAGSGWGCGTGASLDLPTPTHPNPWVKETLHWLSSDTIGTVADTLVTLRAASAGGRTVRLLIRPGEYFEIEYRQRSGYDRNIPASGVLIYHVLLQRPVTPPTCQVWCTQPPLLVEADANNGLLRTVDAGGNRGEPGDAFGLFGHVAFSANTSPPAIGADGAPTTLRITGIEIDEAAGVARFRLSY